MDDCSRCVHAMLRLARAIQPGLKLWVRTCGFFIFVGSAVEAPLAVPRRAAGDSWLLVSARSHHPASWPLCLLATMDRATLLRAALIYLHARDVRALRITAPAAQSNAISIRSEA